MDPAKVDETSAESEMFDIDNEDDSITDEGFEGVLQVPIRYIAKIEQNGHGLSIS